tara:strand:- start:42 stop:299 length:258 start_codon:yes stop_codon:yes gene_type:complete
VDRICSENRYRRKYQAAQGSFHGHGLFLTVVGLIGALARMDRLPGKHKTPGSLGQLWRTFGMLLSTRSGHETTEKDLAKVQTPVL